jgi:acyl-CoA synthetase (AMP-forming)/AMP-acid ligase II
MPPSESQTLLGLTGAAGLVSRRFLADADGNVTFDGLVSGGCIKEPTETFRGRSLLISCDRQLPAALALLQLDGIARRLLLCPSDLTAEHLAPILAEAEVDAIVTDGTGPAAVPPDGYPVIRCHPSLAATEPGVARDVTTEWVLFTSGTTGRPKLVVHTLASLTGPLNDGLVVPNDAVWSTFYDIRRYGGLQILLRALLGGGSIMLSQAGERLPDMLARAGRSGVTHMSGTPSHWRRALMSPAHERMSPRYVRLSGEVADQAILDALAAAYPNAAVAHAFASTEAGVGFDVCDGRAGFPIDLIGDTRGAAELRVADGSLRIRSTRTASRYLGGNGSLCDADGFVDTGDLVEPRGDRYYFVGRREGIINVGGQKVHPEEVEAVINQHPAVRMARVKGRRSPITGAIVVAEVVLRTTGTPAMFDAVRAEILEECARVLPAHKIPTTLREVASLDVTAAGKLARSDA